MYAMIYEMCVSCGCVYRKQIQYLACHHYYYYYGNKCVSQYVYEDLRYSLYENYW